MHHLLLINIEFTVCFFSFCKALNCPDNTVYDPCFSGCPATCSSAATALSCNTTCQETCRCEDGLVLDRGNCVDPSQCGCTLENGVYIPVCKKEIVGFDLLKDVFFRFFLCSDHHKINEAFCSNAWTSAIVKVTVNKV